MLNVTKSYLPDMDEYIVYLKRIWENHYLTNNGPLVVELETKLKKYLKLDRFHFVSNGTIALQLVIKSLNLNNCEIITTPFSFVATTNTILWENCKPVFVDIDEQDFNIDVNKIEEKITPKTKAIMAVHVFGNPCNVKKIEEIAKKYNLKVIYDAAHAFGVNYKGKSLLDYGDISTCSFHATKVFHTVEGGACVVKDKQISDKLNLLKKFGFENETYAEIGINAKNSEFHAAMGLCVFNHIDEIINTRKKITELYNENLKGIIGKQKIASNCEYNYIYYPVLFDTESDLLEVLQNLNENGIYPRRYFYPSLNKIEIINSKDSCPISENISSRIACLPLDTYLTKENILTICKIISNTLKNVGLRKD